MKKSAVLFLFAIALSLGLLTGCSPYPPDITWETEQINQNITSPKESEEVIPVLDTAVLETTAETPPPETEWIQDTEEEPAIVGSDSTTTSPEGSTMTETYAASLVGQAYYWAPSGTKIHTTPYCSSLKEVIYAGTLAEAESVKDGGFCKRCKSPDQTREAIMGCYTYADYMAKE